MANFIQNGITFTSYKDRGGQTIGANPIRVNGLQGVDSEDGGIINVVDIDWNGAQVNGATIDTTGQLLNIIAELQNRLDAAETLIRGLYASMSTNS